MKSRSPSKKRVHFIGIGGIGVSALARWFLNHGYKVSGSDISISETTNELKKEGVKIFIGHRPKNVSPTTKLIIYSAAIPQDNPELKRGRRLKMLIESYAEALGDLTKRYKTIAVAGAHGKSTSTALLSLILIKGGFDPTVIIGTKLKEFRNRNFRNGRSRYLVIEADEYHRSFLNYSPISTLITNIDREHLDFYRNLTDIKNAFLKLIGNIEPRGILILNNDDKNLLSLKQSIEEIAKKNKISVYWYGLNTPSLKQTEDKIRKIIKIPGSHNVSNALGVYILSKKLGVKDKNIYGVFGSYKGAWRRMEYRGKFKPLPSAQTAIYDDYAHHPTEIKATLSGLAENYPNSELICVFQPHQAKRLEALFNEFTSAFDDANVLILLDIYKVPGRDTSTGPGTSGAPALNRTGAPIPSRAEVPQNIDSVKLAESIRNRLKQLKNPTSKSNIELKTIIHIPSSGNLAKELKSNLSFFSLNKNNSTIIVMMGAGDIYNLTNKLVGLVG